MGTGASEKNEIGEVTINATIVTIFAANLFQVGVSYRIKLLQKLF